jgi:hypothetical protein
MKYRRRVFFTDKQKSEIWDRWQRGESMNSIGRRFDRSSSSIYPLLAGTGGIRPPDRLRSRLALPSSIGKRFPEACVQSYQHLPFHVFRTGYLPNATIYPIAEQQTRTELRDFCGFVLPFL